MLVLFGTTDAVQVITSNTSPVDVQATYVDHSGTTFTAGRKNTAINTATTTQVVAPPGAGIARTVKKLNVRNKHATTAVDITLTHTDGTTIVELFKISLAAGYTILYDEIGLFIYDNLGRNVTNNQASGIQPAVNAVNINVLAADVINNNATANTIQDVTGLAFAVNASETYWFEFTIAFTSAVTSTGARFSINGPAFAQLSYVSRYSLASTSETLNQNAAYDQPAAANLNVPTAANGGNLAVINGIVRPTAAGSIIARFASEVVSSAITAKAGSLVRWIRTL